MEDEMGETKVVRRLKQKAKTGVDILADSENDFTIVCHFEEAIDNCLKCQCSGCRWKKQKRWVRLDDVLEMLKDLLKTRPKIRKK